MHKSLSSVITVSKGSLQKRVLSIYSVEIKISSNELILAFPQLGNSIGPKNPVSVGL